MYYIYYTLYLVKFLEFLGVFSHKKTHTCIQGVTKALDTHMCIFFHYITLYQVWLQRPKLAGMMLDISRDYRHWHPDCLLLIEL